MAEWPVKTSKHYTDAGLGEPIEPGVELNFVTTQKDGELYSILVHCPRCGEYGDCPVATEQNPANSLDWRGQQARVWATVIDEEGRLTMNPSILCTCGGHYWLTDGVLREV